MELYKKGAEGSAMGIPVGESLPLRREKHNGRKVCCAFFV